MNKNLTQIAFILDRSGSMASMAEETIGGFNTFLAEELNLEKHGRGAYASVHEGMSLNSNEICKRRRAQRTKEIGF